MKLYQRRASFIVEERFIKTSIRNRIEQLFYVIIVSIRKNNRYFLTNLSKMKCI